MTEISGVKSSMDPSLLIAKPESAPYINALPPDTRLAEK